MQENGGSVFFLQKQKWFFCETSILMPNFAGLQARLSPRNYSGRKVRTAKSNIPSNGWVRCKNRTDSATENNRPPWVDKGENVR